ncbi:MAG: glutathione S-transferase family protein [Pseudomonadota bacterium]|nr:glutathione S-transferase family protein [Pseudomonadota bacterium]
MQLYIGNKNYSSWSLRPWLLMREAGIPFEEKRLRLSWQDDSAFKTTLLSMAPTGRVPLLVDDGFAVWDSLAIAEYLAERFPEKQLWPVDPRARARARCVCAEMHSGFAELRNVFGMNIEASLPDIGARMLHDNAAVRGDLQRIDALFTQALEAGGGPFLFGARFGIADAYFAPVCTRIRTYALPVGPAAQAYVDRILALPSFREWEAAALAEHDFVAEDELYRKR